MTSSGNQPADLLQAWLQRQLSGDAAAWLEEALAKVADDSSDRMFYKLFGFVPRKLGKEDLNLSEDDFADAGNSRDGWNPEGWRVDQAARLLLLLRSEGDPRQLFDRTEQLFLTADVGELIALYRGLPLYPQPDLYAKRGPEGLRTNIKAVFEAVAHRSPFPREQFDEGAWNQMVLKALFIETSLSPIQGLDDRTNETLAVMLLDYAHERWAAHRTFNPELWRCVGPHANQQAVADLAKVLRDGSEVEKQAAALALSACPREDAKAALAADPAALKAIESGELTWQSIP